MKLVREKTLVNKKSQEMIFENMIRYIINQPKLQKECIDNYLEMYDDIIEFTKQDKIKKRKELNNICEDIKNSTFDVTVQVSFLKWEYPKWYPLSEKEMSLFEKEVSQ